MHEWLTGGSPVKAIVGHYGSGKTEIALNAAIYLRAQSRRVRLVDLDIVNPFFRSADQAELLRAHGVEVISPPFAGTGVDIPALGPEILRAFEPDGAVSILDVGGDDAGAIALGQFKPRLDAAGAELYCVLNPFRPRSGTAKQVIDLLARIQLRARVAITGILLNANVGGYTTPAILAEGHKIAGEIARAAHIPIAAECATREALAGAGTQGEVFPITRYLKPEWMEL